MQCNCDTGHTYFPIGKMEQTLFFFFSFDRAKREVAHEVSHSTRKPRAQHEWTGPCPAALASQRPILTRSRNLDGQESKDGTNQRIGVPERMPSKRGPCAQRSARNDLRKRRALGIGRRLFARKRRKKTLCVVCVVSWVSEMWVCRRANGGDCAAIVDGWCIRISIVRHFLQ
jgi:hypothetical protein